MGASEWNYRVPYQEDLTAALRELRQKAFAEGDYLWEGKELPRPASLAELEADPDPAIWEEGLHSILDVFDVVDGDTPAGSLEAFGAIRPVTEAELAPLGIGKPTAADLAALHTLMTRGGGRCAVLHDADGRPVELYFFGATGD